MDVKTLHSILNSYVPEPYVTDRTTTLFNKYSSPKPNIVGRGDIKFHIRESCIQRWCLVILSSISSKYLNFYNLKCCHSLLLFFFTELRNIQRSPMPLVSLLEWQARHRQQAHRHPAFQEHA